MGGPAAAAATGRLHCFPAALTSFIGRDGAVREVAGLLEEYRLVTVTGPGGSGKTRLAGQVARRVADRFADGAWLAELAPVRDPAQVASAMAAALGVVEQPRVPAQETLARVLAGQQLLLVLDNCEHLIGAAAQLCAGLLAACDDVRVLVTSREPLAVAGEARYRLAPLSLPDPDDQADAGGSEAVALFADRARRADARFALDRESGPAVGRLVARLDGMPLAIELAAARVEALGVAQLLDRLDDRFALLADGDRLAAGRHRSLAATVEWSYQLLEDHERQVFRRLSVFPGPFTLQAAEAVAGAGAGAAVLHLVDCSLLSPPRAGPDGRSRYGMLETLRAYGSGLLAEAGEHDGAAAALAGYAVRVAEQAATGLQTSGAEEVAAARWLDAEDATMRQVLAWVTDHDPAAAVRLAAALGWWWLVRARLPGQYGLLREVAGRVRAGSDGWCAVLLWVSWAALFSSDLAGTLKHATALRDAAVGRGPSRALADGLVGRAIALFNLGRTAEAAGEARQALAMAREIGYPAGEVMALGNLSFTAGYSDDMDRAVQFARQGRADHSRGPRLACPVVQLRADLCADQCRGHGRRRGGLRGGAGPGPGCRRCVQPVGPAAAHDNRRIARRPRTGFRGAPARRAPDRHAEWRLARAGQLAGLLRAPVRRDRAARRGRHDVGRIYRPPRARRSRGCARRRAPPGRAFARCPPGARAGTDPGPRRTAARR